MSKIFLNQIQEAAQLSLFTTNNLGAPTYFNCATANRVVAINSAGNAFELKSFANWDTAFSWGNHASAGYLTSFTETDPVFSASPASGITNTNISNWNTAFGWGNHASAGYLTGNQTITLSGQVTGSGTTSITTSLAANTVGDTHIRQSAGLSVIGRSANSTGNVADITAGSDNQVLRRSGTSIGFGTIATAGIANSAVTLAKIANIATSRILGRVTAGSGVVEELTGAQATTLLDLFSTSATTKGLVPGSNGVAATHYLDASGNWSVPAGGGAVPTGGTTGQVLSKIDNTDYNTQWITVSGSGTVTSVAMSVPTGFSVSGSPITTSGTLGLTFAAGYSLPTDANQTNWSTAFSWGNHASAGYLTSIAANSIGNSQLRQSNGYSVIGRSASTTGDVADITAANDFEILRRTAGSLGFGSIDLSQSGAVGTSRLDFTNIKQGAGLSVIGVAGNAAGNIADITAGSDHHVLRRSGTSIGFGTLNAAAMNGTYTNGQYLQTDGSGNLSWATVSGGGGLTNFTEAFSSSTQATSSLTATNAATNVNAALVAKGTGATVAQVPDGAPAAGNSRGIYATDWQKFRSTNTDVASGAYSTISGGRTNRATASDSTVVGGQQNVVGSQWAVIGGGFNTIGASAASTAVFGESSTINSASSFVAGSEHNFNVNALYSFAVGRRNYAQATGSYNSLFGWSARGDSVGQMSHSSGPFSGTGLGTGEAQRSDNVIKIAITGTSISELFTTAAAFTGRVLIPSNKTFNVVVRIVAVKQTVGSGGTGSVGDSFIGEYACCIKNVAGTTSMVGTVQTLFTPQADSSMTGSVVTITADDANDAVKVEFTPDSASSVAGTVTRVVAHVALVEVSF